MTNGTLGKTEFGRLIDPLLTFSEIRSYSDRHITEILDTFLQRLRIFRTKVPVDL